MRKILIPALLAALLACPAGLADEPYTEEDIPALLETIGRLEAEIDRLEAELEEYRRGEWHEDSPAAEFNGGCVTVGDARAEYETRRYYYEMMGADPDAVADDIRLQVLQELTEDAVLRQKAAELGVAEPDGATMALIEQEAEARYQAYREYYAPYQHDPDLSDEENEEKLTLYLEQSGMGRDEVYRQTETELWSYQSALFELVTAEVTATDEELLSYYNAAVEAARAAWAAGEYIYDAAGSCPVYHPPGYRSVSAFLIPMEAEALTEFYGILARMEEEGADQAALLARMDELYAPLNEQAADCLQQLAAGGDLAEIAARCGAEAGVYALSTESYSLYDGAFLSAALSVSAPGGVTSAQGTGGVWVIRYDGDIPEGPVPLEDISGPLTEIFLAEKKLALYNETVEAWLREAEIRLYPERI